MRTASEALKTLIHTSKTFYMAELYEFNFIGGTVSRHTNIDWDIEYNGHTYDSKSVLIDRGSINLVRGIEVDELSLTINPRTAVLDGYTWYAAARHGYMDGARVSLQRAFFPNWGTLEIPAPTGVITLFTGRVSTIDVSRTVIDLKIKSDLELFNIKWPRHLYQPLCTWTLYDPGCRRTRAEFTVHGSVASGSTKSIVKSNISPPLTFIGLGQTSRSWTGMTIALNGNIYAAVFNGDVYRRTIGIGDFVAMGQTSRKWYDMTTALNGDIYATVYSGDIYKQVGGSGNFVGLGQTVRDWTGITTAPNGDIYACVYNGDIYKQTGGAGNFLPLGQTTRYWYGMTASPSGDIYACVSPGDIYKQAGGVGDFVATGQTTRQWYGMTATPNGDVYAVVYGGDVYRQLSGSGIFVAMGQTLRNWFGMTAASSGDVYATVYGNDIYRRTGAGDGYYNLGTIRFESGVNAGSARTVKTFITSGGTITLINPLLSTPAIGDLFEIYPGCDRTLTTCADKFSNITQFRGFPFTPQPEAAL